MSVVFSRVLRFFIYLHALCHTFATNLVNGVRQPDGTVKALTVRQVADLLGHSTTQVTEMYYVKKDTSLLNGITDEFCLYGCGVGENMV